MDERRLQRAIETLEKQNIEAQALGIACANILANLPDMSNIDKKAVMQSIKEDTRHAPIGSNLDRRASDFAKRILDASSKIQQNTTTEDGEQG